ncbi:MAG: hypothetical protein EBS53_11610 [Bacteroidetes bacterium]|nr:hypothetical protein [Bacteroidota bacterium]
MSLTKASFSLINGANLNVLDYGAAGNGLTDDTAAFQAAIEAGQATATPIFVPVGIYKITDTLDVYNGTQIIGDTNFAYPQGYGRPVNATTISFEPATAKPLFDYSWKTPPSPTFVFHTGMKNLFITGNAPATATYGMKLNAVIYGNFVNIVFENFNVGFYCDGTINNRFENCMVTDAGYVCVDYAGNSETTDVWEQCSFFASPVGIRFNGPAIGVRFNNCLWEQIEYYGLDISSRCQSIMVANAYCEDVPYGASPPADGCMFRVGQVPGDSASDISNHLIVTGGMFNGRNAGIAGAGLFDIDYCWGIYAGGFVANRWPYIISTDPTNTQDNSVTLGGYQGISWSNNIDNLTKVCGFYANGVLNTGAFNESATFFNVAVNNIESAAGFYNTPSNIAWLANLNSPEGAVTAPIGSLYSRINGGAGTSFYVKESGTGNTGWVAK